MYYQFFGFKDKPFKLAPDPKHLFLSKNHDEVMTSLVFEITKGDNCVLITGEVGTGKTTLCRAFCDNISAHIKPVFIATPELDGLHFLRAVNDELFVEASPDKSREELLEKLKDFIHTKKGAGLNVLLLIDDAQGLSQEAMQLLDILAGLEDSRGRLLQVILVGQPELEDLLASGKAGELGERITKKYRLGPMTLQETTDYIKHRISLAALKEGPSFDTASCRAIHDYSRGIPKLVNIACEMTLQKAFTHKSRKITAAFTREAINTLTEEKAPEQRSSKKIPALAVLVSFFVILAAAFLFFVKGQFSGTVAIEGSAGKIKAGAGTTPAGSTTAKTETPGNANAVSQAEPGEQGIKTSNQIASNAGAIASAPDKQPSAAKPVAVNQAKPEKISGDLYSVHAGSFNTAAEAQLRIDTLKSLGFASFGYSSSNKKGGTVFVAVAGKYPSLDVAKEASRNLNAKGFDNFIARAKDSLNIPAGSKPVDIAADKPAMMPNLAAANEKKPGGNSHKENNIFSVHAGTFRSASEANMLLDTLNSLGLPSFMYTDINKKGKRVYVVVAGKYPSLDVAKETSRNLSEKGFDNFIARAKDSLDIPAGSKPVDIAADKPAMTPNLAAANEKEPGGNSHKENNIFSVHAGTFHAASEANLRLDTLKSLGLPSFMYTDINKKGKTVYVVVAGKYPSLDVAKETSRNLSEKGFDNFIARAKDSLDKGP